MNIQNDNMVGIRNNHYGTLIGKMVKPVFSSSVYSTLYTHPHKLSRYATDQSVSISTAKAMKLLFNRATFLNQERTAGPHKCRGQ